MRFSALMHYLENIYNNSEDRQLRSYEVSRILVDSIQRVAHNIPSRFLLAGIYQHSGTTQMLKEFAEKGIATVDISQDQELPELRILPSDGHPNARSHRLMTEALLNYLKEMDFVAVDAVKSF